MIDYSHGDSDNNDDVIAFFKNTFSHTMSFTRDNQLQFRVSDPASMRHHFNRDIAFQTAALKHLAGQETIEIEEVERDDVVFLRCSGPGAIRAARIIRDEAGKKFNGSANIPERQAENVGAETIAFSDVENALGAVLGKDSEQYHTTIDTLRAMLRTQKDRTR